MTRRRLKDFLLSVGLGLLVGVSPFTPDDLLPSVALGGLAGLFFYLYRLRVTRNASEVYWDGRRKIDAIGLADVPPLVWAVALVTFVVFAPTLAWMYGQWTGSVWQNNHGIFVPVVMLLLARSVLRRQESVEDDTTPWGFAFVAVGLLLVVLDSGVQTRYLAAIGLVITLPGFSLLILGLRRTKALRVALMLGIFMIPIPATISNHLLLRNATAAGTLPLLHGLGIPASRDYSVLNLRDSIFVVSEACSGFATLYSALALTIFLALYCRSNLRRGLLLLAFVPLALAANVARVLALILLAEFGDVALLDTALHEASGVVAFFAIIAALFALADRNTLRSAFA